MSTQTENKTKTKQEKLSIKKKIHEAALEKQKEVINDLKTAVDERRDAVHNPDHDDIDYHNRFESTKEEIHDQIKHFADQLNVANAEFDLLDKIKEDVLHDKVTIGTVVETDQGMFYVAVGLGEFEEDGSEVFGLSSRAPLYQEMEFKKPGDVVSFRGRSYEIKEVM